MNKAYPLGQTGYLFDLNGLRVVVDPYLTDSVADQFGEALRRQSRPTLEAEELTEVSWVLVTHAHLDHADPASLAAVAKASSAAVFVIPYECESILLDTGITASRIRIVTAGDVIELGGGATLTVIPAAHTERERDELGRDRYLGFYLKTAEVAIYHAGDTIPHEDLFRSLEGLVVDFAFLPVNERNFFRHKAGIVGNMTPREAFAFAEEIKARVLVPTHWDLFAPNSTFPWEVECLYGVQRPSFTLTFMPSGACYALSAGK